MKENFESIYQKPASVSALVAGFNTAARYFYLAIFPISLDLFLWFAPHFKIRRLANVLISRITQIPEFSTPQLFVLIDQYQRLIQNFLEDFNLAVAARTYPTGIPSLLAGFSPKSNPLGLSATINIENTFGLVLLWLIFSLAGMLAASTLFNLVAQVTCPIKRVFTFKTLLKAFGNALLFPLVLMAIFCIISIPVMLLVPILSLVHPLLAQCSMLLAILVMVIILFPLIFVPYGIFIYGQNILTAIITSITIFRYNVQAVILFVLATFALSTGLNLMWQDVTENSWFLAAGIVIHGFIAIAILAAYCHFFIDATHYTQALLIIKRKHSRIS